MAMNNPPPTQTTAAPTWSIMKTKYQGVFAANTIETMISAAAIKEVATMDVRRRLSALGAATTCSIDLSLGRMTRAEAGC